MRLSSLCLLLTCLPLSAAPFSGPTKVAFGKLKEAIMADAKEPGSSLGSPERRIHAAQMQLNQMEQALDYGIEAWAAIENLKDTIQSNYQSPAAKEAWQVLLKTGGEESRRGQQTLEERAAALTARLKTLAETATQPEEFDEIILQLDPAQFTLRNEGTPTYRQVESARVFAMAWQEYLTAKAAGDRNRLTQSLSQLLSSSSNAGQFIPRSRLLREQSPNKETGDNGESAVPASRINGILDQIKAPADLTTAISEINQLMMASRNSGMSGQIMNNIVTALGNLQRTQAESEAGLGVRLDLMNGPISQQMSFGGSEAAMVRIRTLVFRPLISSFAAQATTGEIRAGESIEAFIQRALKNAMSEGDLDALARLASLAPSWRSGMVDYGNAFFDNASRQATSQCLTSCFAARSFEAAGEPLSAVLGWHAALKSGSPYTPASFIGTRLEALKKIHPEIYAEAMVLAVKPVPASGPGR